MSTIARLMLAVAVAAATLLSASCARIQAGGPAHDTAADDALLEEISHAAFLFFEREAHPVTGLVPDKTSRRDICSVASMGYGLAVLPIGVERGWITRERGEELALRAMRTLDNSGAVRHGMFAHFLDMETGQATDAGYESVASSIDSALMIAGAIVAGEYFGGEVAEIADRLYRRMDWRSFSDPDRLGQIRMAWQPNDPLDYAGEGTWHRAAWRWYTDETLLIALLAIAAPEEEHRMPREALLNWVRPAAVVHGEPFTYTWSGGLFTYIFAQNFYDFRRYGRDLGQVDWWRNTQLAIKANRDWCREMADTYATYGQDRWGVTSSSGPGNRYAVPGAPPRGHPPRNEADRGGDARGGVLAPYGAGMAVPFMPEDSIAALRHMRHLVVAGQPLWVDPADGGYGLVDAFSIDHDWVGVDWYGIANGPMVLSIENHRSGLVWDLFMANEHILAGLERAGFQPRGD